MSSVIDVIVFVGGGSFSILIFSLTYYSTASWNAPLQYPLFYKYILVYVESGVYCSLGN